MASEIRHEKIFQKKFPQMLSQAYQLLFSALGPQHWWPGESPLEVMVGAVLTQNTSWKNVERAIDHLRDASLLEIDALSQITAAELAEIIRPAGYYRLKAKRLKNLISMIVDDFGGDLECLFSQDAGGLRTCLLEVNGIGPETADSIVLYAAQKPIFVVDTYTARVLKRHGWIHAEADYHELQDEFHRQLPEDVSLFNEFHALLVRVGKQYCRPKPQCDDCPLCELLPDGGPISSEP